MPTGYKPTFEISAGGQDVTARFADRCLSIIVELTAGSGAQDSVVIVLDDRDYKISLPRIKQRLDVRLGYNGIGTAFMGSFEVNKIIYSLPPRIITIHGTAASNLNELKTQRINNFSDKTVEQILAEVGRPLGFKVDVHPQIADQTIPRLDSNTSFGSLIGRLERQYDAVAKINDGRVSLVPRSGGVSVSDIAQPTYVLRDYSFADLEVVDESAGEYAKVVADHFDKDENRTPADAAMSALSNLDTSAIFKLPHVFASKEEAQAKAKSVMAQLDRSGKKISATLAEGDPWIRDLQRIVVADIREGINGSYTLDAVRHSYEKLGGLRTSFAGVGGVNGLAEEYGSIGQPGSSVPRGAFLDIAPGQVFGQILGPADTVLGSPNSGLPRLVGQPQPSLD